MVERSSVGWSYRFVMAEVDNMLVNEGLRADLERWTVGRATTPVAVQHRPGIYARIGKHAFDLVVTVVMLPFVVVAMGVIALLVRVTLGRHVMFSQTRVGRDGEDFTMYKFRTMKPSRRQCDERFEGQDRRVTHKTKNDPRHTRLGRLLRKTSLDELPQFFNVLKGDMSLVGPRPEIAAVVDRYGLRAHARHVVLPGITGIWQVTKRNDGLLLHECFDADLAYIERVRLSQDLKILVRTLSTLAHPGGG